MEYTFAPDTAGSTQFTASTARAGAIALFTAVSLGAFGAHGLEKAVTPERLQTFQTGVEYHFIHGLGLFVVAWSSTHRKNRWLKRAAGAMMLGIGLFSGSLYALVLSGWKGFAWLTPLGGLLFLWSWLCVHFGWQDKDTVETGER